MSLYLKDYPAAVNWARRAMSLPNFQWLRQMVLPSALAHQGAIEEVLADLLERALKVPFAYALEVLPMAADDDFYHMFVGLYLSGLPRVY